MAETGEGAPKPETHLAPSNKVLLEDAGAQLKQNWSEQSQPDYSKFRWRLRYHTNPGKMTYVLTTDDPLLRWEGTTAGNRKMGKPQFDRIQFDNIKLQRPNGAEETRNVAISYHPQDDEVSLERGDFSLDITDEQIRLAIAEQVDQTAEYFKTHPQTQKVTTETVPI